MANKRTARIAMAGMLVAAFTLGSVQILPVDRRILRAVCSRTWRPELHYAWGGAPMVDATGPAHDFRCMGFRPNAKIRARKEFH